MNAYTRTSANTRKVTNELRDLEHYMTGRARFHARDLADMTGPSWEVAAYSKTYGSYALGHEDDKRVGVPIMVHVKTGTYWVRPARRSDGSQHIVDKSWREMAAETRYLDVLLDVLEAGNWSPEPGSESRESLAAWRESRRHG